MNGVLSPWANSPRLGLIGNPENRRIRDFQRAVEELGGPAPACLSYAELLRDPGSLDRLEADLLRIDSPGEDEAVGKALIKRGGGPADAGLQFGEIGFLKEYHRGFCDVLDRIDERGIPCLNSPREIAVMFDKWECHRRFVEQGVERPASELAPGDFSTLHEEMRVRRRGRLFLKPLHGSSASGVCALRWTADRRQLIAPIRIQSAGGRVMLVNSLRVQTYTRLEEIELILGRLLPQGMIMEQWVPKLTLPGGAVDLRVLVIAGEPRHRVVRQSRYPMTNLHLGNQRGDITALQACLGAQKFETVLDLAVRAAACFPESLYAGVDVLIDTRHRALAGEINAFGDLLPRLVDRDESAYTAIAKASHAARAVV